MNIEIIGEVHHIGEIEPCRLEQHPKTNGHNQDRGTVYAILPR